MNDFDRELFVIAPLAAGLLLLGSLGLVFSRMAFTWRFGLSGLTVTAIYSLLASLSLADHSFACPLLTLTVTGVVVATLRFGPGSRLFTHLQKPLISGCALLGIGLLALAGSYVRHQLQFEESMDRDLEELAVLGSVPDRGERTDVRAYSDRGSPVQLSRCIAPHSASQMEGFDRKNYLSLQLGERAIRREAASDDCNCHGWVFTGGRYIVPGTAVEGILKDNGYRSVPTASPGDLAIYRGADGSVLHTAVVRYIAPGRSPMVEGKWGSMGVYLHNADESCYGKNYTFYRSNRDGDVLRGIDPSAAPVRFTGAE